MTSALTIRQLTKTYGNGFHALKGIDLEVAEGDFFALLGPNGAGKSTTIGILSTLVNKTGGTVEVFGHDLDRDPSGLKRCLGVVPQEFNFNQFEKAFDILVAQAGYYGIPARLAGERAEKYLTELGLWDKRNVPSRMLSGGMKRRLMIARALIHQPRLLILDEPTAGVDIELRRSMWSFLTELNQQGITIILTTHYLEEAEALADHVAVIDRGRMLAQGSVAAIRAHVAQRRIRCVSALDADAVARWPGVRQAERDGELLRIVADAAEPVVRRLLAADDRLHDLEVQRAGLADAFLELTRNPQQEAA